VKVCGLQTEGNELKGMSWIEGNVVSPTTSPTSGGVTLATPFQGVQAPRKGLLFPELSEDTVGSDAPLLRGVPAQSFTESRFLSPFPAT
jgi:hypothetical protein